MSAELAVMDKQYHIECGPGDVGRYVLLPGDPGRVPVIAGFLDDARKVAEHREYTTYTGRLNGVPVSVTSTGIGGPSTAIAVEELARIGADTFIRVGTSGRMQPQMQAGDLIIVAGRPAMGKTTFALNLAEHIAIEQRLPVAIFSMEMPGTQLATRFISSVGRIDMQKIRSGRLTDDDWQRLTMAMGKLYDAPLYIDETPGLNPIDLRARARRLARQCGRLGLIVIDYLQLMSGTREGDNRASELSEISRSVKSLAKELNVPIMALSQLNRSLEQRPNKRPVMSDLRESGAIEQDADIIMFIYRDEVYNPDSPDKGTAELIIGKHRNGPTGTVRLTFIGENTRFENYAAAPGMY